MAVWTLEKIGAKFPGSCIVCGGSTTKIPLAVTPLYVAEGLAVSDGEAMRGKDKHGVAHPECVGARVKNAINGPRLIGSLAERIDTNAAKAAAYVVPAEQMAEMERLAAELRETAAQKPPSVSATWPAPADLAAALKLYDRGIADEIEVSVALQTLREKVAARKTKILAATPGRKIEVD